MTSNAQRIAQFFRQRQELGFSDLTLDQITRVGIMSALQDMPQASRRSTDAADPSQARQTVPYAQPAVRPPSRMAEPAMESPKPRGDLPVLPDTLEGLHAVCSGCTQCGLAESRSHVVFADGVPDARLMVVGEAPGAQEDETGFPFVGRAGMLLDLLLQTVGLSRKDSVYICNVIKCRPPGNRNPSREEIAACSPYLKKQITLIKPEVILAVGTFSGQLLSGKEEPLGQLRGVSHAYEGVPLVVTYHPAALLRNPGWVRPTWDDLQRVARMLRGENREMT
jgi:uracil-DNA glycosylase